jgi:hypothetical protein
MPGSRSRCRVRGHPTERLHEGQMAKKTKLKRTITLAGQSAKIHDRKATDLTMNAQVGTVVVEDPYEAGGKIVAFRSLRDDTLATLHHHRQIDDAQLRGGRHWQKAYEMSEVGGAKAIDPTKEAVDGGGCSYGGITDAQSKALAALSRGNMALGMEGEAIVRDVLGSHLTLVQAAVKRGLTSDREVSYMGRRLRECLETLAVVYGYAMPKPKTQHFA